MTIPNRESDKFVLRLPDGMRDRIKDAAAANNRSMNAEIVRAIEFYFAYDNTNDIFIFPESDQKQERLKFEYIMNELRALLDQAERLPDKPAPSNPIPSDDD